MNIHLLPIFTYRILLLISVVASKVLYSSSPSSSQCPEYRMTAEEKQELINELTAKVKTYRATNGGKINIKEFTKDAEEIIYPEFVSAGFVTDDEIHQLENNFESLINNEKAYTDADKEKIIIEKGKEFIEFISGLCKKALQEICLANRICQTGLVCVDANAAKDVLPFLSTSCSNNQCYKKSICIPYESTLPAGPGEHCTSLFGCKSPLFCHSQTFFQSGLVDLPGVPLQLHENCDNSSDCNSNLCQHGKCVKNTICTDCIPTGQSASQANQCCTQRLEKEICQPMDDNLKTSDVFKNLGQYFLGTAYAQDQSVTGSNNEVQNYIKGSNFKLDYGGKYQGNAPKDKLSTEDRASEDSDIKKEVRKFSASAFPIPSTSDFTTCNINLKADYLQFLKEQSTTDDDGNSFNLLDLEYSFLAFEFVTLGPGTNEFWKNSDGKSFHETMGAAAGSRMNDRNKVFQQLTTEISTTCDLNLKTPTDITNNTLTVPGNCSPFQKITCICYDRIGYPSLNSDQQAWFKNYCGQLYVQYEAEQEALSALCQEQGPGSGSGSGSAGGANDKCKLYEGDPTGQKYRLMMIGWIQQMINIQELFLSINVNASESLYNLKKLIQSKNWGEGTQLQKIELYNFTVSPYNNLYTSMAAIVGAILAGGVIAILSALSIPFSAWMSAGFITASMGTAMLVAALHGAWRTKAPYLEDEITRSMYKCGKKDQCQDYKRVLYQPYNQVCNAYISANACIKYIKTANFRGQERYLLDPFIPYGMNMSEIINDNRLFAALLNNGFKRLLSELDKKKQTGSNVSQEHLITPFIDTLNVGAYAPELQAKESYQISSSIIDSIKQKASEYAINQGFLSSESTDLQKLFADYTYEYHFLWPKLSDVNIIAYPAPGFHTYLDLISFGQQLSAEGNLAALAGDQSTGEGGLYDLLEKYLADFIRVDDGLRASNVQNSGTYLPPYIYGPENYPPTVPINPNNSSYYNQPAQTIQTNPLNDQLKYLQQLGQLYGQLQAGASPNSYPTDTLGGQGAGTSMMDLSETKAGGLKAASTLAKLNDRRNQEKAAFDKANLQANNSSGGKSLAAAKKMMAKEALSPSLNASALADEDAGMGNSSSSSPMGMGMISPLGGAGGGAGVASSPGISDGGYLQDNPEAQTNNNYGIDDGGLGSFESSSGEFANNLPPYGNTNLTENGMQAVDYKNLVESANAYQAGNLPPANNDLTIWNIVTNAYFRSYRNLIDTRHIEGKKEEQKP